jgi:D-alanyl-lipoteichoic acid acyltransferase DltB (MBOAT superfamily)
VLFNSYAFLFGFFPVTVAAYLLLRRLGGHISQYAVLAASLGFYAWWDIRFLPLLISLFSINYAAASIIFACVSEGRAQQMRFSGQGEAWLKNPRAP